MNRYEVEICRDGKHWCRIVVDAPWSNEVLADLQQRFVAADGYDLRLFRAEETSRLLEASGGKVRVLAVDYQLEPWSQDTAAG